MYKSNRHLYYPVLGTTSYFITGNASKLLTQKPCKGSQVNEITAPYFAHSVRNLRTRSRTSYDVGGELAEYKTGLTRQFAPANKEWKDSVYSYNKSYLRAVPFNNNQANKLIRGHFNMHGRKSIARSRRMRARLIRFSSTKVYVSKPEVKQNNDKVIITVYIFDRERQFFVRKLFFYWRKPVLYNSWLRNNLERKITAPKYTRLSLLKSRRKSMFKLRARKRYVKGNIPMHGIKFKNQMDFLRYRISNFSKRFFILDKSLLYLFISYFLSRFNIKVWSTNNGNSLSHILNKKPEILLILDAESKRLNVIKKDQINEQLIERIEMESKDSGSYIETDQELLVNRLWEFIQSNFFEKGLISYSEINKLYKKFRDFNYKKIMYNLYRDEARSFYNYTRMEINRMKFTSFIPTLKSLASRLYNKTTELNIVNLKYIHLNGDLFTQAIASKLKKKKGLLKILRKSFALVKIPSKFNFTKLNTQLSEINKYDNLTISKLPIESKATTFSEDRLDIVMKKLFPIGVAQNVNSTAKVTSTNSFSRLVEPREGNTMLLGSSSYNEESTQSAIINDNSEKLMKNKVNKVLTDIKFKWVSGLRLEAAGRLTRRNTASRSVFKFKYKGNLKNKQYYIGNGILQRMQVVMLRKNARINTQYTFTKSKRRIGSFGLKSWISGY